MPTFERGTIIRVPFPYTDRDTRQRRPALVVSDGPLGDERSLLWVLMITSAENRPWPGDVAIDTRADRSGLPVPSVIRTSKIATIEARHADSLGSVGKATLRAVEAALARSLGLAASPR